MIKAIRSRFPKTTEDYSLALTRMSEKQQRPRNDILCALAARAIHVAGKEMSALNPNTPKSLSVPRRHKNGHPYAIDEKKETVQVGYTTEHSLSDRFHEYTVSSTDEGLRVDYKYESINVDCQALPSSGSMSHEQLIESNEAIDGLVSCASALADYVAFRRRLASEADSYSARS